MGKTEKDALYRTTPYYSVFEKAVYYVQLTSMSFSSLRQY